MNFVSLNEWAKQKQTKTTSPSTTLTAIATITTRLTTVTTITSTPVRFLLATEKIWSTETIDTILFRCLIVITISLLALVLIICAFCILKIQQAPSVGLSA